MEFEKRRLAVARKRDKELTHIHEDHRERTGWTHPEETTGERMGWTHLEQGQENPQKEPWETCHYIERELLQAQNPRTERTRSACGHR
jgi:hypothetical protein